MLFLALWTIISIALHSAAVPVPDAKTHIWKRAEGISPRYKPRPLSNKDLENLMVKRPGTVMSAEDVEHIHAINDIYGKFQFNEGQKVSEAQMVIDAEFVQCLKVVATGELWWKLDVWPGGFLRCRNSLSHKHKNAEPSPALYRQLRISFQALQEQEAREQEERRRSPVKESDTEDQKGDSSMVKMVVSELDDTFHRLKSAIPSVAVGDTQASVNQAAKAIEASARGYRLPKNWGRVNARPMGMPV